MGDDKQERELKEAKLRLYKLLLEKGHENFSENEIEITWNLARDGQVQGHLSEIVLGERAAEAAKAAEPKEQLPNQ